jgi:cytochrome c oxidase cbb3-type subunit I/II
MEDPRTMSPGSIMPPYPQMIENDLEIASTPAKIRAMQKLGVPYPDGYDQVANADLQKQANSISADLANDGIKVGRNNEIIAFIAYLQRLGTDIKNEKLVGQR